MADDDEAIDVTMSLTARVKDVEGKGGYDLTGENGEVSIAKFGAQNRKPRVALADLKRAVTALERVK